VTVSFKAIVAEEVNGKVAATVRELTLADLPDEDVLVDVAFSTLNYKDGLALSGRGKICRKFPMVCGADLAGTVAESRNPQFKQGDRVLVNGFGMSERFWGGYTVMTPMSRRQEAWDRLAQLIDKQKLASLTTEAPLGSVPSLAHDILDGKCEVGSWSMSMHRT
jgi:NADPH:quinone reductase-like Zn-dependent oxidoreductase